MLTARSSTRDVLRDKRGIATSIPEALGGTVIKAVVLTVIGGVLAVGVAFWAQATTSTQTSSDFQTANAAFEKAVHESDIVIGMGTNRVGILRDLDGGKCEVQTWQNHTRDGNTALQVDISTVAGTCLPTTPLLTATSAKDTKELAYNITTPVFSYENLGGRAITFDSKATATLEAGTKPAGTKEADWADARPYKVTMSLQSLDEDNAATTRKSVSTGYTNVVAVTEAADNLRFVPAPSTDPIPGPVRITSVARSSVAGAEYGNVKEGLAVSFTGGVCLGQPSKVTASFEQQSPSAAPVVSTVISAPLDGSANVMHLSQVPNGSTGDVEIASTCVTGGVASTDAVSYTQPMPKPALTVREGVNADQHVLTWNAVSSLRTSFQVSKTAAKGTQHATPAPTTALTQTLTYAAGTNFGNKTTYRVTATVAPEWAVSDPAVITGSWPATAAPTLTSNAFGATWTAVTCPAGTAPEYASRFYKQVGTDTTVTWSALSAYSTARTLTENPTPAYGRTTTEARARCVSSVTGLASPVGVSAPDRFYVPEAINVSAERSTTVGTAYQGAREGLKVTYTGGRCYNDSRSEVTATWQPASPSGQTSVSATKTAVLDATPRDIELSNVRNGAKGLALADVSCTAGKSATGANSVAYTQTLPKPALTVAEGTSANQHVLSWKAVSSLPTTFQVTKTAANGTQHASPAATTALTMTLNYTAGTNYANKTTYRVTATVAPQSAVSDAESITGSWPATDAPTLTANASGATWTAITCPAGTTPEYASRFYKQVGTDTTVTWSALSAYSTSRALTGNATPEYGRTTTEARARCVSTVTGLASPVGVSASDRFYTPEAIRVSAERSTTVGTAYQGAREGLKVTYTGGRCYNNTASAVTAKWQPATPAGQSDVASTKTAVLDTTAREIELSNVRNGAKGAAAADVSCTAGKSATGTHSVAFTQTLPAPVLTAAEGTSANQHVLSWKAVSSLPTTFQVAKTAAQGTQHATPAATTALTQTLNYTAGTNYGNKTNYTVTATVNSLDATSTVKSITGAWPTAPSASDIAWKHTGATAADSKGTVTWGFEGTCPAGTTLESRLRENREGQRNGTYNTTVKTTTEWAEGKKSYAWDPAYALQGYSYGVNVQVQCVSDVTGLASPVVSTQSPNFTTPVTKPAVAKWNAINVWNGANTGSRPTYETRSSCRFGTETGVAGGCVSIRVDYITYCPTGSWVGWSNFSATDWNPATYNHPFGWGDYWLLYGGDRNVTYHNARYQCFTPWVDNAGTATPENPRAITSDPAVTTTVKVRGE